LLKIPTETAIYEYLLSTKPNNNLIQSNTVLFIKIVIFRNGFHWLISRCSGYLAGYGHGEYIQNFGSEASWKTTPIEKDMRGRHSDRFYGDRLLEQEMNETGTGSNRKADRAAGSIEPLSSANTIVLIAYLVTFLLYVFK
jgi:hypothetical protein